MLAAEGERQGGTAPPVLLHVIVQYVIRSCAPAGVIVGIKRTPNARAETVDEMALHGVHRRLLQKFPPKKIGVVGKKERTCGQFRSERTPCLGKPDFRFEKPAVGAYVDQFVRVVLPAGRGDGKTYADDDVLLVKEGESLSDSAGAP